MEIFPLQRRLKSLMLGRIHYSSKALRQNDSPVLFLIIIAAHVFLIITALAIKTEQNEPSSFKTTMQLVQVKPENTFSVSELPEIEFKNTSMNLNVPELNFQEIYTSELDLNVPQSDPSYELSDGSADQYKNVFDPKLRKKLIDAQVFNVPRKKEKPRSWAESDGRVFVDMGDGQCLVSMQKMDSRERGTSWGFTHCGKTDSEKMMDNVTADLEARKHPLKVQ